MMRVLVVGSGGREHALVWKVRRCELVSEIFAAPGNAGTANLASPVRLDPTNIVEMADFAQEVKVDLTVVGPEVPLSLGIADEFGERGLRCFGPLKAAAEIESSKVFAKEFLARHGIPTAAFRVAASLQEAEGILASGEIPYPIVVKADGLAAGKGVVIADDPEEAREACRSMLVERRFGNAGERIVLEERLEGVELSFHALTDGRDVVPLASAQDYKRIGDGDEGPNTGGMGVISPSPYMSADNHAAILEEIVVPAIRGLADEGRPYRGVLYAGLMLTEEGPKVLEFNARFGDPETQAILPRMESDLVPLLFSCVEGDLGRCEPIRWRRAACACVVASSEGYPGPYETGFPIEGLKEAGAVDGVVVYHAGTARDEKGRLVTAGGRVLDVCAVAPSLKGAVAEAYEAMERIRFDGMYYRRDIGKMAVVNLELGPEEDEEDD